MNSNRIIVKGGYVLCDGREHKVSSKNKSKYAARIVVRFARSLETADQRLVRDAIVSIRENKLLRNNVSLMKLVQKYQTAAVECIVKSEDIKYLKRLARSLKS